MRHISLGNRGFGIAAPKVATAELSMESVGASKSVTPSRSVQDLRMTPQRPGQRPSSSHKMAGTPTAAFSQSALSPFSFGQGQAPSAETPTRPILIRNQVSSDAAISMLSGSILASTLRPEPVGQDRDIQYSNAIRAEDAKKLYNSKLLAGALPELPSTLSPKTALSPWLTVINPSNPDTNDVNLATLHSRWQHVFPRPQEMRVMKWKSLCSPAAVPLTTEYFPTKAQFESEYARQPYNVSQNLDDELSDEPKSRDELLRELVSLRFTQGFQIVVGPAVARAFGQKQVRVADVFSRDHMMEDGTSIFMSVGNTIHQLSCVNGTEVEVNIFVRKPTASFAHPYGGSPVYKPAIRTLLDSGYMTSEFTFVPPRPERNWNYIDAFVAGHNDELSEHLRFWRARFVLIPMTGARSLVPGTQSDDSEEEIRIEGIRRLAQIWQKHRYVPPSERRPQGGPGARSKKDTRPLDIVYKTEDPSVVIAAELETLPLLEGLDGPGHREGRLVRGREKFSKKSFSLAALAEAMQQPVENGGVRMQNRRWHFRLHYNCFIGSDMTSWLLDNFEDLEDREEAEALGNRLMVSDDKDKDGKKEGGGLFVHVERRHPFRDGQYFYQIVGEYAKQHAPGWFNSKRSQGSVPSTPMGDQQSRSSFSRPTSIHDDSSPSSGSTTPTGKKPRVVLSKVIRYDVDHRRRSYRPEIVELHYDRLHNPDNCYHIRIDWMNVTAKLVEDAIENWGREAAQYGLRLVEVPIAEACAISEINPFRRPYVIKLAVAPPDRAPVTCYDPNSFMPQVPPGRHFYQKAILRKFDFVLDMEAASNFPSNVDVTYSWGKPDFKYSQYIHRSGCVLAQITDEGDLLLLANRLYSSRAAAARDREIQKELRGEQGPGSLLGVGGGGSSSSSTTPGPGAGARGITPGPGSYTPYGIAPHPASLHDLTPTSSPSLKPTQPTALLSPALRPVLSTTSTSYPVPATAAPTAGGTATTATTTAATPHEPELIKDELEAFCTDAQALENFYAELRAATDAAVAAAAAGTPGFGPVSTSVLPDGNIPVLGLPPGVLASSVSGSAGVAGGGGGGGGGGDAGPPVGPSSRAGSPSPAFMSASHLLRRGSVQYEGLLGGLRGLGGGGSGGEKGQER